MTTINLGKIKPLNKGAYSGGVTYRPLDFTSYLGNLYVCRAESTGNLPTDPAYFDSVVSVNAAAIPNTPAGSIAATTVQAAINELGTEKANLASPALTGIPTAPTPVANDNSTNIATTAYVQQSLVNPTGIASINGGQLAGMRNKIINGKMEIAQRGAAFISGSSIYTVDRWMIDYAADGGATTSQSTDVPSSNEFQSSLRVTQNTADTSIAAAQYSLLQQRIEGFNARDLLGRTFVVSFWVRSSKTGIHCVALRNAVTNNSGDRSYIAEYTINSANTWEFKTITVSGGLITAGANWNWTNGIGLQIAWVLASGSGLQTTAGAWQTGNYLATANQVNCLDTVSNVFAITGVQLEVGSVATPFEHRFYGLEEALCQRYWRPVSGYLAGLTSAGTTVGQRVMFTPMRVIPTATIEYSVGSGAIGAASATGVLPHAISVTAIGNATGAFVIDVSVTASAEL